MKLFRSTRSSSPSIFAALTGGGRHSLFTQPAGTRTYRPQPRRSVARGITGGYLPKHTAPTGYSALFGPR